MGPVKSDIEYLTQNRGIEPEDAGQLISAMQILHSRGIMISVDDMAEALQGKGGRTEMDGKVIIIDSDDLKSEQYHTAIARIAAASVDAGIEGTVISIDNPGGPWDPQMVEALRELDNEKIMAMVGEKHLPSAAEIIRLAPQYDGKKEMAAIKQDYNRTEINTREQNKWRARNHR